MDDGLPDDVMEQLGIGPLSKDQKIDNFETSTIAAILRQLGWAQPEIKGLQVELGPGFSWDWFNDLAIVSAKCGSTREFRFRFEELVTKPTRHEITEAFGAFLGDSQEPHCLVFHVYDNGRWIATNLQTAQDTSIHVVTGTVTFNVLPFAEFFKNRWERK